MSLDEIRGLLESVPDSYEDFVVGIMLDIKKNPDEAERLVSFIQSHPNAKTDRIIGYMDGFPDEYFAAEETDVSAFSVA